MKYTKFINMSLLGMLLLTGCASYNVETNQEWCDSHGNCSEKADVMLLATDANTLVDFAAAGTEVNGEKYVPDNTSLFLLKLKEDKSFDKYHLWANTLYFGVANTGNKDNYLANKVKIFNNAKIVYVDCFPQSTKKDPYYIERICEMDKEAIDLLSSGNASVEVDIQNRNPALFKIDDKGIVENIKYLAQGTTNTKSIKDVNVKESNTDEIFLLLKERDKKEKKSKTKVDVEVDDTDADFFNSLSNEENPVDMEK